MRRFQIVATVLAVLALAACTKTVYLKQDPSSAPPAAAQVPAQPIIITQPQAAQAPSMPVNTRLIFHGGSSSGSIYTFCDRGNRVYFNMTGQFSVVNGSCPDGQP
jgi:hypothetical protein